jgi:serine/threonine protein kinase
MNPERWNQVKQILDSAMHTSASERGAFVERACGEDTSLCKDVNSLLAWETTISNYPQSPIARAEDGALAARDLTNEKLGHYQILEKLGAGGMGEVYRAKDLALGRQAAIKILSHRFSQANLSRLAQEAEAAAKLQHPNIATLYEYGRDGDTEYIAMEYVAGETLRSRISRGAVDTSTAIMISIELLEALSHAHAAGILHRDIKPENIMLVDENLPKLLDFGLAINFSSSTVIATKSPDGIVIAGTLGYMAPEQARGEANLDARSDLFSLGAVIYEALSGEPAFPGNTGADRLSAVLFHDPAPLTTLGISPAISDLVQRALQKDRASRYSSAAAFLKAAQALLDEPVRLNVSNLLAVMDFNNLSDNSSDEWLGIGIAETLITDLARLPDLKIVPRDRIAQAHRPAGQEIPDSLLIAQTLGCRWMLEGGFQKLGTMVRITARLMEVATQRIATTEKMDGSIDQIFSMQDRLSAAVANALKIQGPSPADKINRPILTAYECYNRGRRYFLGLQKGGLERATDLFGEAIKIDPRYALAYAGLASIHAMKWTFTTDPTDFIAAKQNAYRAIDLDPSLGEPHIWLGYVLFRSGQTEDALEEEIKARKLDPSSHLAIYFEGLILKELGRMEEAISSLRECIKTNPQFTGSWTILGSVYLFLDEYTEAVWCLQNAVQLERQTKIGPGSGPFLAETYRRMGNTVACKTACLEALDLIESSDMMLRDFIRSSCLNTLGRCALFEGDLAAADAAFTQTLAQIRGRNKSQGAGYLMAQALAGAARARGDTKLLDEASDVFKDRSSWNFSSSSGNLEGDVVIDLGIAAAVLGRTSEAQRWLEYAKSQVVSQFRIRELEQALA